MYVNSMDFEVQGAPTDSVSALEFSPGPSNHLCAGSWDRTVRTWNVDMNGVSTPRACCELNAPVLDVSWHEDASKIYVSTTSCEVYQWDLQSNRLLQVGLHEAGVRTCHAIRSFLVTGSWDKKLKFWDTRTPVAVHTVELPDRCFAADVKYPMAVVCCANKCIATYTLQHMGLEQNRHESLLKQEHRCVDIFRDDQAQVAGFVVAGIEGQAAVHYLNRCPSHFKCHNFTCPLGYRNIYAVNDVKHHPVHNTLATAGSDGTFSYWDYTASKELFTSTNMDQPVTKCCFNADGQIFAYALGYDWAQGHEHYDLKKQPRIRLHPFYEQMVSSKTFQYPN